MRIGRSGRRAWVRGFRTEMGWPWRDERDDSQSSIARGLIFEGEDSGRKSIPFFDDPSWGTREKIETKDLRKNHSNSKAQE